MMRNGARTVRQWVAWWLKVLFHETSFSPDVSKARSTRGGSIRDAWGFWRVAGINSFLTKERFMNMRLFAVGARVLVAAGLAALCGCEMVQPSPRLPADAFVQNQPAVGPSVGQGVDHSGPLIYDAQHRPPVKAPVGDGISET